MKPLATQFRARGFSWRIVQREGDIAIVEQSKYEWTNPVLNVVIVQKHKARKLPNGEMTVDAEGLPSWEQWGDRAWCCSGVADAKARFNKLVDTQDGQSSQYISPKAESDGSKQPETA